MFDFEKLDVYQVVKNQNLKVLRYLSNNNTIDPYIHEEWKKATMGMVVNLAEATGRITDIEKRDYLAAARGCIFQSVAIADILLGLEILTQDEYNDLYAGYEQGSKMLLGMYRSYLKPRSSGYNHHNNSTTRNTEPETIKEDSVL